jgi:transcriptional regulator with XRE-family HTH domain
MQHKSTETCNSLYNECMPAGRPATTQRTDFGEKLYQARLAKGLSQIDLAELVSISQQAYASWERKPTALKPEQLVIIARALEVSIDSLLGLTPKVKHKSGPVGKLQLLLEEASKLPRSQQNKISDLLEPFIVAHSKVS